MLSLKSRLTACLFIAFAAALPSHAQIIIDPPGVPAPWILEPGTVNPDQDFSLSVVSLRYSCAHEYANQKVVVQDNIINLSFTSSINPVRLCPAIEKPYGPAFKVPALKAGRYQVKMNLLQPCHVQVPMCRMAIPVEDAGTLVVGAVEPKVTYVVNPLSVAAGKDFTLNLLSPQFTCNVEYLRTSSLVQDNRITLTFLDKANPAIKCMPQEKMYGPAYKMGALKAGTYEVWAVRLPACVEQGCKINPVPELVGKLTVTGDLPVRKGWFVDPGEVKAGTGFTLNVLNNDYGNCNTEFERTSLTVQGNAINVSFVIVSHPERVCIQDKRPHGPSFQLAALKAGLYPVTVSVMPACLFTEPRCLIGIPEIMPIPSDTLHVVQTLGVNGMGNGFRASPAAAWRGQALEVSLPSGAQGIWKAEVVGLDGKRLASSAVDAARGNAALKLGRQDRKVVMLRLTAPDRAVTSLRIPIGG